MKILNSLNELINEGILSEAMYNDLFEFLGQGFGKMTQGTAYYVSSMDTSMNKNIIDPNTGEKIPNPMYGKIFKHTRFMFPWGDTYARARERKGIEGEIGQRSGQYEKIQGFDMLESGKSGLYLPILPSGSEYVYAMMDGNDFVPISKEEVKPYLRPSGAPQSEGPKFRLLIVNNIAKLTGGGNVWTNPDFKLNYIGPGAI